MRLLGALLALACGSAFAEGHVSLTYQNIHIDGFEATTGELDIGTTDTHTLILEVEYALTERWTISGGIPFVRKRYRGDFPHSTAGLLVDPDSEFVDDGDWHSDFQDWHLGLSYKAVTGRFSVEPFVGYSSPISDYPFYGHAAVGQNIWHFEVGAHFSYVPGLSDFFYQVSPSYVFAEETLGESIDHWRLNLGIGYRFLDGLSGRVFVLAKQGDGLDFPDDFPLPRNTELWYKHDRLVKHNYVNVGIGIDWQLSEKQSVSSSVMHMVDADQVHRMDYAFSVTFARAF